MNMSGDIRVKTDQRYRTLYNDLKNFIGKDMHQLFFLCACIGYREGKPKPLGKAGDDRFYSKTITPEEYACFCAMMIEENSMDFSVIQDDKAVIARMEEYANGGMEILLDDFLSDHLIGQRNEPHVLAQETEIPRMFLNFIHEQIYEQVVEQID